jgi:predicted small secreted protein
MIGDRACLGNAAVTMKALPLIALLATLAFGLAGTATAQGVGEGTRAQRVAQKKKAVPKRAPTRIRVTPVLRYRLDSTPYPRTDNLGYPGPNAVRQCVSWLAPEYRPSGTVITPHMRCWWERG